MKVRAIRLRQSYGPGCSRAAGFRFASNTERARNKSSRFTRSDLALPRRAKYISFVQGRAVVDIFGLTASMQSTSNVHQKPLTLSITPEIHRLTRSPGINDEKIEQTAPSGQTEVFFPLLALAR
jgi:hypothetical protein